MFYLETEVFEIITEAVIFIRYLRSYDLHVLKLLTEYNLYNYLSVNEKNLESLLRHVGVSIVRDTQLANFFC